MNNSIPKVMVVDDDINNCKLIEEYLLPYRIDVIIATSGIQAIEICSKNPGISLILMDILMRDMNGFQTAEKIQKIRKDIRIVYQTAYANDFLSDELMKNLVCGYIEKPIKRKTLLAEIGKYVEISKKEPTESLKAESYFGLMIGFFTAIIQ